MATVVETSTTVQQNQAPQISSEQSVVVDATAQKTSSKKKKKSSIIPVKRTITSKNLKSFTETELRNGLKYMLDKKLIPKRPELGNINKLSHDALTSYCRPYSYAIP